MSRRKLRKEKTCLNCGTRVEKRFCPECGQENVENRPSVGELFSQAFGAVLHLDSNFWKTIKTLIFRPGVIINEYLAGKRKSFVPPIRLYIFASFFAFILPVILPDIPEDLPENEVKMGPLIKVKKSMDFKDITSLEELDSIQNTLSPEERLDSSVYATIKETIESENMKNGSGDGRISVDYDLENKDDNRFSYNADEGFTFDENYKNIETVAAFDSIHFSLSKEERMNSFKNPFGRKLVELHERKLMGERYKELGNIYYDLFVRNLPTALFIYLPFFAFFLWVFHGKKKWKYYDHAIFTLFYFSLLLILISLNIIFNKTFFQLVRIWPNTHGIINFVGAFFGFVSMLYAFFYFFRAHSRVYKERKWISRLKSFSLFWINFVLITLVLIIYTAFTLMLL